jgi:hypothetical protein
MKEDQPNAVKPDLKPTLPGPEHLSRLPPSIQKLARILSVVLVLVNIGMLGVSLTMALGSFFLFDAPNAGNSRPVQIMFWLMFTAPLPLSVTTFGAGRLQERGRYLGVVLVTFLAVLYLISLFIVLIIPK